MTSAIVEQIMKAREKSGLKLTVHYSTGDWTGYAKDRAQLDRWIAAAKKRGLVWTFG